MTDNTTTEEVLTAELIGEDDEGGNGNGLELSQEPHVQAPPDTKSTKRDEKGLWLKGYSGNPKGRAPLTLDQLAEQGAEEVLRWARRILAQEALLEAWREHKEGPEPRHYSMINVRKATDILSRMGSRRIQGREEQTRVLELSEERALMKFLGAMPLEERRMAALAPPEAVEGETDST